MNRHALILAAAAGVAVTLAALVCWVQIRYGLLDRLAEHVTYTEGSITT